MRPRNIYLTAAFFSLLLYLLGVFSGLFIEKSMTDYTEARIYSLQRNLENLQLEYAYLSIIGKELTCEQLSSLVGASTQEVWKLGKELDENDPRFEEIRRDYALLSTKAWILNSYVKDRCNSDAVVLLYFYSVPCEECIQQGYILDELREEYKNRLLVFVLNSDLDEPIVNTLKITYNIQKTPAIIIDEKTFTNLTGKPQLMEVINQKLQNKTTQEQ
ncbi:MAG: hypothetical protein V1703_00830 [Candidatus Altiarchaeota archaeon]